MRITFTEGECKALGIAAGSSLDVPMRPGKNEGVIAVLGAGNMGAVFTTDKGAKPIRLSAWLKPAQSKDGQAAL